MTRRRIRWVSGVIVFLVAWGVGTRYFVLNISASVPVGLYRQRAVPAMLSYGQLVIVPVPEALRAWQWVPLLKPVVGLPGDMVCILDNGVWVEQEYYGVVETTAQGKRLPQRQGCAEIQPGEVFLAVNTAKSLDGRYFGPVPQHTLTALVTPVWTWE